MNDERQFLHDLSNPLSTALFIADELVQVTRERQPGSEALSEIVSLLTSLERARDLITERRRCLLAAETNSDLTAKVKA